MFKVDQPTIRDLAWEGKGTIKYFVRGLERWNNPAELDVEVKREHQYRSEGPDTYEWTFKVNSLGYSILQTEPQAYLNYAAALKDAATKIEELIASEDQLEAIFQQGEAHRKAEHEREQAELRAKREADKPVGKKLAKKLIETMKREVKKMGCYDTQHIMAYERGTRKELPIKVEFSRSGMGLFSLNWSRISKADAIVLLADSHLGSLDVSGCPALPDPNVSAFLMSKS
jgi:hypothetical protein